MTEEYSLSNLPDLKSLTAINYDSVPEKDRPKISTIGVLTSGGDAPGMNASIRAVVRAASHFGIKVFGITRGFHGLWKGEFDEIGTRQVSETLQRGGTFLMTARSKTFETPEGVLKGAQMCKVFGVEALVVIGGDGSYKGARDLARIGVPVIGLPGTIDNDIACTEYTIGYDTAMNTAMEAIDKLRDTASSHERCSVIEVMGRRAGYIALNVGIANGAEVVLIPEQPFNIERDVVRTILDCRNMGKRHYIVIVAEGAGDATEIAAKIEESTGIESRPTILGHLQRGGRPTLRDRLMASLMGIHAIECIQKGMLNRLVVYHKGSISDVDIEKGLRMKKTISLEELNRSKYLA
ncbi:MAG: 6-phosphofructokinase [Clostridiaceae bacterium]|nr:6-phosphofructokinase [Clostridiaceae bacterium]